MDSRASARNVQIIAIGNELLNGLVTDTNSSWLCRQLTGLGAAVTRVVVLPDDIEVISHELQTVLSVPNILVITMGGLGATADDLTLEAIARAISLPLAEHPGARAIVARRFQDLYEAGGVDTPEVTPERLKMACLPQGSRPLDQNTGAAPGAYLALADGRAIAALPGVPAELKDIFMGALQPILRDRFGEVGYLERSYLADCKDESSIVAQLRKVSADHPDVYVKARAMHFGPDVQLEVLMAAVAETEAAADRRVRAARDTLARELESAGVSLVENDPA